MSKGTDDKRLLTIPLGLHGGHAFPTDVDIEPKEGRYVGFYENQHGEQLVFVRERGEQPMLYHGDYGWAPLRAEWPERHRTPMASLSPWVSGDLVLNQGEVLWLASCLSASASVEEANLGEGPLDRLLMQAVKEVFQHEREEFDRKQSLTDEALNRWKERQAPGAATFEEEHYAEGAILVAFGLNTRQRKPRRGVTKEIRQRIEQEVADAVREVQG